MLVDLSVCFIVTSYAVLLVKTMTVVMSSLIWGIVLAEGIKYGLGVLLHANVVYVNWLMMAGMFVIFFLLSGFVVLVGRRTLNDEDCLQEILSDTD